MKISILFTLALSSVAATLFSLTACQKDDTVDGLDANGVYFTSTAQPFNKSYDQWAQEYWTKVITYDCAHFLTSQVVPLDENVSALHMFYIDSIINVTLSKDKALFISLAGWIDDYPCPNPDFKPASGQSLEAFLQADVVGLVNLYSNLRFSFDGMDLQDINSYRFMSDLFYFTGNPDLTNCFDPCITGESQAGVVSGYYVLLNKMKPGTHVIVVQGDLSAYNFSWNITVTVNVQ